MSATLTVVPADKPVTTQEWLDQFDKMNQPGLYLTAADWQTAARGLAAALRHTMKLTTIPAPPAKPVLRPMALLDVAQADKFLMDLDCHVQGADASKLAYLLGQAEGHLQTMTEIISAITGMPR